MQTFGLHLMMTVVYDSEQLTRTAERLGLQMVVLFGSRARNTLSRLESDLDIAVLDPQPLTADRWWEVYTALANVFCASELDLVWLNPIDPLTRYEIMRHGMLLYGDRTLFDTYRIFAYRDFIESEDLRRLEDILFHKKIAFIRKCLYGQ